MEPIIDHIEITVKDMATAVRVVPYEHPRLGFAITSPLNAVAHETINRRKPGSLHHLAFRASSRADVDRFHVELQHIGATIVHPPREYPEYTPPGYYALYFKDPDGIKYEIVCTAQGGGGR